jgi:uncharacterized membrane protein YoaK (UPF0700 family)
VERQSEKSPGGPIRAGALAFLIFGFLVLVTFAASGGRPTRHGHLAARPVPSTLQDSWVTLMTITYAVVIVGVLLTVFRRRRGWQDPGSHWLRNYWIILVFMALFTVGAGPRNRFGGVAVLAYSPTPSGDAPPGRNRVLHAKGEGGAGLAPR